MKDYTQRQMPVGPSLPPCEWSHGQTELDDYLEARARIEAIWRQHESEQAMRVSWLKVIKFVLGILGLAILGYAFTALGMAL